MLRGSAALVKNFKKWVTKVPFNTKYPIPHVHVAVSGDNKPKDVKHALNPVNL